MRFLLILIVCAFALSCDGDTTPTPAATPDGGVAACGEGTEHEKIINAATTAEVVMKVPQHPAIGPGGLP